MAGSHVRDLNSQLEPENRRASGNVPGGRFRVNWITRTQSRMAASAWDLPNELCFRGQIDSIGNQLEFALSPAQVKLQRIVHEVDEHEHITPGLEHYFQVLVTGRHCRLSHDTGFRANYATMAWVRDQILTNFRDTYGATTNENVALMPMYDRRFELYNQMFRELRSKFGLTAEELPQLVNANTSQEFPHLIVDAVVDRDSAKGLGYLKEHFPIKAALTRHKQIFWLVVGELLECDRGRQDLDANIGDDVESLTEPWRSDPHKYRYKYRDQPDPLLIQLYRELKQIGATAYFDPPAYDEEMLPEDLRIDDILKARLKK